MTEFSSVRGEGLATWREKSKAAKATLKDALYGENVHGAVFPDAIREALEVLVPNTLSRPSATGTKRVRKATVLDKLASLFSGEGSTVSLMTIFTEMRMGEREMYQRITQMIRDRMPESRYWITYDAGTETYTLQHIGPDAPIGWNGPVPIGTNVVDAPNEVGA